MQRGDIGWQRSDRSQVDKTEPSIEAGRFPAFMSGRSPMKKFLLIVGASVGFILGSRSGRRPYELLETQVRKLAYRSDVQYTVDRTKWAEKGKVGDATTAIGDTAGEVA
jgi:hypothetical protein